MAIKKYLSLEKLTEYNGLVKNEIDKKSDIEHTHSWEELTNKPFGEEIENGRTFFHSETVTSDFMTTWLNNTTHLWTIADRKVYVLFNDVEYESTVVWSGGSVNISFGDYTISQNITDENAYLKPTVEGETYSLYIEVAETTVTKISKDYLPTDIAYKDYVDSQDAAISENINNHTHDWKNIENKPFSAGSYTNIIEVSADNFELEPDEEFFETVSDLYVNYMPVEGDALEVTIDGIVYDNAEVSFSPYDESCEIIIENDNLEEFKITIGADCYVYAKYGYYFFGYDGETIQQGFSISVGSEKLNINSLPEHTHTITDIDGLSDKLTSDLDEAKTYTDSVTNSKANASDLTSHTSNKSNPHNVTASQLGLSSETWTFTLSDGSTVTKTVVVM